jgi:starvation-inducible DNA-binding protein
MTDTQTAAELRRLQADATVFYQKLRTYHWTVVGPQFFALHGALESLYDRWAEIIDDLAEQLVISGQRPLTTLREVLQHARLSEDGAPRSAEEMVRRTVADLEKLVAELERVSDETDGRTENLLEAIRDDQEKTLWMWRSLLAGSPAAAAAEPKSAKRATAGAPKGRPRSTRA